MDSETPGNWTLIAKGRFGGYRLAKGDEGDRVAKWT